jgi:hypothetical protein
VWILGCDVSYNDCEASGGGIYSTHNPFDPNTPNCYIRNCLLAKNKGYWGGGLASSYGSFAVIESCTIAKNNVDYPEYAGGLRCKSGSAAVTNSIIWGNAGRSITVGAGLITVTYSDVQMIDVNGVSDPNRIWQGEGNINEDPLFANPIGYDYHLQSKYGRWNPQTGLCDINDIYTSPCVDAGDPFSDYSFEPEDNGSRINMGTYGNTPQASKSGVDVIRYFPGDIDQSGCVNFVDYVILANNWLLQGAAIKDKRADVNNDGIVDGRDLNILAKFWLSGCS